MEKIIDVSPNSRRIALIEPLRERTYRTIWLASLLSNFGQLIQGVGAAWEMTRLTSSAEMVALVQTAITLPMMLAALPAGAIADMFDRRKVALIGLGFACLSATGLTVLSSTGLVSPWALLAFCFLIGVGVTLYGPAWQASIGEQVSAEHLPSAIALGSISYNVARSFGPAIGGIIVATAGAVAAFAANAFFYIPLMLAFLFWRRPVKPSRLPPERIDRAIISGMRYAFHSPPIRTVLVRSALSGLAAASVSALTPLVARELLHGTADTYGLLLGVYGVGAVAGAFAIGRVRASANPERAARWLGLVNAVAMGVIGLSNHLLLTCTAMLAGGAAWMLLVALLNVSVQLSAPRWVTARAVSCYTCALTGGIAFGAWGWGVAASHLGITLALVLSGLAMAMTTLLGFVSPLPKVTQPEEELTETLADPEVQLALTPRSGPIVIEIDYRVDQAQARNYYGIMQQIRSRRLRSGGFGWSLSRDVVDPELWTESYSCPTWGDYLRQRSRTTQDDRELQVAADAFHIGSPHGRVRRRLERPFGSVRWRPDSPDLNDETLVIITP
ncbi:MFS transporter [Sphingobium tyrosinilyticum]|uniref:MFS transporter n=1 Tax=Sphingobium tyrosinilyticum TaxID=2715436 RepID=A0ABV9F4G6_9SPHN